MPLMLDSSSWTRLISTSTLSCYLSVSSRPLPLVGSTDIEKQVHDLERKPYSPTLLQTLALSLSQAAFGSV